MHVLEFTLLVIGLVTTQIIVSPSSIYNKVEQYKLDCYEYYKTKYEQQKEEQKEEQLLEEPIVEPIKEVEVVEETQPGDLGILSIPSVGIRVGLYSDGNAFQSSGKASVQYYAQYGIKWIADHVNQDGFGSLKNLSVGSKVYINETEYTVTENIYAADYYSNFSAWVAYIGDSTLLLQTCEGDGARLVRCE